MIQIRAVVLQRLSVLCLLFSAGLFLPMALSQSLNPRWDQLGDTDAAGSVNVPMDSWIYPGLERLGAMDLIPSQNLAVRPWTRAECLRQLKEAEETLENLVPDDPVHETAASLINDLDRELNRPEDHPSVVLESFYGRYGTIAGPAVADSFHFGQTWWNDFGRPLGRGGSAITGFSVRANRGRYFFYTRDELQQSPTQQGVTPYLSNLYLRLDMLPFGSVPPNPTPVTPDRPAYTRFRPLELYAGVSFLGNNLSFGKQQIYWGPNRMGPLSFSSNAEPTYNLRFVSTRPHPLPLMPSIGTYKFDVIFGKLSGHTFPARPYYNGQKVSFNLLDTLELSFTRWSIFLGQGHPMTLGNLKRNFFSSNSTGTSFAYGDRADPGDRKAAFDFNLHVPGLRRYLTVYADSYADDEVSPLAAPRRVVWAPGFYLARIPGLSNVDLRLEMTSTEELSQDEGGTRFYINNQYRNGNTNKGFLLGSAAGRDARVFQGWVTYWKSARTTLTGSYRQTKGSSLYLEGGSTISDAMLTMNYAINRQWSVNVFAQYERFLIPSMRAGSQHNGSGWFQITWHPESEWPFKSRSSK